ncbi:MAG: hypothetical protein ABI210_04860 [Abditibacteriaceae bacterium]
MLRKVLYSTVVAFVSFFISGQIANASPPAGQPPKDAQQAYTQSSVVFLGSVRKVYKDGYGYNSTADVQVVKYWKGQQFLAKVVRVDGKGGPTYPARIFENGKTYLFYLPAPARKGSLRADSYLQRVLRLDQATDDLKFLTRFQAKKLD